MEFEVNDLTNWTTYRVSSSKEGRDATDRSAIEFCEEMGETVTLGKVIVRIIRKDK